MRLILALALLAVTALQTGCYPHMTMKPIKESLTSMSDLGEDCGENRQASYLLDDKRALVIDLNNRYMWMNQAPPSTAHRFYGPAYFGADDWSHIGKNSNLEPILKICGNKTLTPPFTAQPVMGRRLTDEEYEEYVKLAPTNPGRGRIIFRDDTVYEGDTTGGRPGGRGIKVSDGIVLAGQFRGGTMISGTKVDFINDKQHRFIGSDIDGWKPEHCSIKTKELFGILETIYGRESYRNQRPNMEIQWAGSCENGMANGPGAISAAIRATNGYREDYVVIPTTLDHGEVVDGDLRAYEAVRERSGDRMRFGQLSKKKRVFAEALKKEEDRARATLEGWGRVMGLVAKTAKSMKDAAAASSTASGPFKSVMVTADITDGFSTCLIEGLKLENYSGKQDLDSPGYIHEQEKWYHFKTITQGANNEIAGKYRYAVKIGNCSERGKICTGAINLSGDKRNYKIGIYKDCSNTASGEF